MDFDWVAIAVGDVVWISLAFLFGFLSRSIGLPPLVGFLLAGFVLHAQGAVSGEMLQKLSDLGITLLLFTIGLKLNLKTLARPQVWAVTALHTVIIVVLFSLLFMGFALLGLPLFTGMQPTPLLLVSFALSFSSTVFVVKVLEERGEMSTLHGNIAIGVLIMQDLVAVIFLAASSGKVPSLWAFGVLLLIPLRPLLLRLLERTGHGELMILYALTLAMGGAELFELVGMKGDLGALALGVLLSAHPKTGEMADSMLGFKDLFLVGFFLSIGLSGHPTPETLLIAALLLLLVPFKSLLFFLLFTRFKLRARTSLLTTFNLTNYSEFGLIVAAIGVSNGWIGSEWLVVIAIALSLSYVLASPINSGANEIYTRGKEFWRRFQHRQRLADDVVIEAFGASIVILGMGRVGTGAYDRMRERYGDTVVGVDADQERLERHRAAGRRVLLGDPTDADFWDRLGDRSGLHLVLMTLPRVSANLYTIRMLKREGFPGRIGVTARYPDEVEQLRAAGADAVYNIYAEAGVGFADNMDSALELCREALASADHRGDG